MSAAKSVLRGQVAACVLIALVALAAWWPRLGGPIDLRWDAGAYYLLGTSLATGQGYRILSEPGNIPSSLHPPLMPALVAAHQVALGTSDPVIVGQALRLSIALLSTAYATAIYLLLSAHVPRRYAFAAALVGVFQPQYAYFSDSLYTETIFGLLTVLFFILQRYRASTACFLLAGLCAVLAYEARTAGIALLVAWVVDCVQRREVKRAGAALVISLVPVVTWMGWIKAVETSAEYLQPAYAYQTAPYLYFNVSYARNMLSLKDPMAPELGPLTATAFVDRVWANAKALPESIGQAVSTWDAPGWISLPLFALVLLGMLLQARRKQYLMLMYVTLSLAAMCLTPFQKQFVRYLLPLYPFFALALFQLLAHWVKREPKFGSTLLPRLARTVVAWSIVGIIGVQEALTLRDLYGLYHHDAAYAHGGQPARHRLFFYAPAGKAFDDALDWLGPRADPADVVAATDAQWAHLRTGLKAVLPPFEADGKKAQLLVDTVPVKYLIVETKPQRLGLGAYHRFTSALLRENPTEWERVWSSAEDTIEIHSRNTTGRAPRHQDRTDGR